MKRPLEFDRLALQMHADFGALHAGKSIENQAVHLSRTLTMMEERRIAADFIGSVLAAGLSDQALADIWAETPSDCFLSPDHARAFFVALEGALKIDKA